MFNFNDNPDDENHPLKNNELYNSYFTDEFYCIGGDIGTGLYLTTITDSQLGALIEGSLGFMESVVNAQGKAKEDVLELAEESLSNDIIRIFLTLGVKCMMKEKPDMELDTTLVMKYMSSFQIAIQFESFRREGIIEIKDQDETDSHMFITNIEETFIDFDVSDYGKQLTNDNIVSTLCMN